MRRYGFTRHPGLVERLVEELSENERLKDFFIEHDLSSETIEEHLGEFLTFREERALCDDCPGLSSCRQDTSGMQPGLIYTRGRPKLAYHPCVYLREAQAAREQQQRFEALYVPRMVMEATLEDFHMDSETRTKLYHQLMALTNQYHKGESIKGLYLHGRYQVGKTYALGALANRFTFLGHRALLAYYPDLVRELKSSIQTGNLESLVNRLKHVEILLLDDIGGESYSQWVRDEVLGPILQHRLLDDKPTFFSSNVPVKELAKHLINNEQQLEQLKAYRIVERIKRLSDPFNM